MVWVKFIIAKYIKNIQQIDCVDHNQTFSVSLRQQLRRKKLLLRRSSHVTIYNLLSIWLRFEAIQLSALHMSYGYCPLKFSLSLKAFRLYL